LSIEHGLTGAELRARFLRGALLAHNGDPKQGIELMRSTIAAAERNGARNLRTLYLGQLASAHHSVGQPEVGLDLLQEAFNLVNAADERFFEPELYRLRGTILSSLRKAEQAESTLRQAVSIARQQQARWWELRAATTLAQHYRDQSRHAEAYAILHAVYARFEEGFATEDLKHAKALLTELARLSPHSQQACNQ
jgi:tetratricopeptide (TPR) repeat protein